MKQAGNRSNLFYFILLFVISFSFRLILLLVYRFDGLYGQDAYAYYNYSKAFYEAIVNFQAPPNFYWPIGFYLLTSVFTIFTAGNTGIAGLLVSINAGSLVPGFTYLLAYELLNESLEKERKRISLVAGLITAFVPILVKSSIVIMSDALGLMFAVWSVWLAVKYYNEAKLYQLIFSLVLLAFSIMTRYIYVLLLVQVLVYMIYCLTRSKVNPGKFLRHLFPAVVCGLIVFGPQLYYISLHGVSYFGSERSEGTWVSGWNMLNFFRKDFTTLDGTIHYKLWNCLYNLSPVFHPMYLSIFGVTLIAGLIGLIKQRRYPILVLAGSWFVPFYLYLSGSPYQSMRYTMSFLPALAIVSAIGISMLKIRRTFMNLFFFLAIMVLISYCLYHMSGFVEQKNKELEIVNWVNNNIKDNSTVFAFDITLAINHYTKSNATELYNCPEDELKNKIDSSAQDIYIILPVEKINSQWKGLPLESKLKLVITRSGVEKINEINNFTVFKLFGKK